jgi:peptidyl-prolyl cis-trans isomerase D
MLKFFTRLEKTRNFFILIFAILMVISLVFWQNSQTGSTVQANLTQSTETVATVGGEYITVGELARAVESEGMMQTGRTPQPGALLDSMIGARIMRLEADRLGLTPSDAEVAAEIREQNRPEDGRPFNEAEYKRNVIERFGSLPSYEERIRDDVARQKLMGFLTAAVTVSEEAVLEDFQRKNTKFGLSYVAVNTSELAKKITPSDAELEKYFEENKASYRINVPQKKIKYVFVNTAKIGEKLNITDAELKDEYDRLPSDKKIAGVLGQEIVLRVDKPELENKVLEKANQLAQQMKSDSPSVSESEFAELAKGHSENPATARSGGKLSGPVRENPNRPDDPYQRLLRMIPGEISQPINYQGRYFILRRGEDVPKSYETAKKEIEVSLRNRRAYAVAAELAQKVVDSLKETKDPLLTAQTFATQANMAAADMVRETAYVKPGDDVPNIGVSSQFETGIEPLAAIGDVGEKTPIPNGFAVPILVDRKEPRDAELAEVRDKIVDIVKLEKARTQVEEIAKSIAAGAASPEALSTVATAAGMSAKDKNDFILGSPLGEGPTAGTDKALEDTLYAMKVGDVTKTPLKVGDNWYVVGVKSRQDANMEEFAKQRSDLMTQILDAKRGQVFSEFLSSTRYRMEQDGSITIDKDALEKVYDVIVPTAPSRGLPSGMPSGLSDGTQIFPGGGIPPGAPPPQ